MPTLVGMPAHYEMLVSHSPPVFSHSPPAGFLSDYTSNYRLYDPTRSYCRPQHQMLASLQAKRSQSLQNIKIKMPTSPIRPCLVVKPTENESSYDTTDSSTFNSQILNKAKKKVVFADDHGHSLTEIRIMSEPSNVPPLWSLEFLAHVTQGLISPVPPEQWTVTFRQPASDYLDFRKKLDSRNVSLENVIVKETDSIVVGTIKVRNLSFHKEVIVRTSWDDWKSQEDTFCTYSTIGGASGAYVLYDTFSFKLTLPPLNRKLEFCVCFRCDGKEYWDNNDGKNYTIFKRTTNYAADSTEILRKLDSCKKDGVITSSTTQPTEIPATKYQDLTHAKISAWSEFASWNHLENTSPYW